MEAIWKSVVEHYDASPLRPAYNGLLDLIAISPIPRLAGHLNLVLFSFVYFILLDLFIYNVLGDHLCRLMPVDKKSRGLDELNHGGSLKLKWAHMIPSFIHALLVGFASLYLVLRDTGSLSKTLYTRLYGFAPDFGNILAFSLGYFLWDILICLNNRSVYGPSFLAHATMAAFGILSGFVQNTLNKMFLLVERIYACSLLHKQISDV